MKRLRIYVAGPYSPQSENRHKCVREAAQNTDKAIEAGIRVLEKGHIPFIPHLSHFVHTHHKCNNEFAWYTIDNSFLEHWATAILYMAPSKGADAELKLARKLELEIFFSVNEIPELKNNDLIQE